MTTGRNNLVKLTLIILTTVLLASQIFAFNTSGNNIKGTPEEEIPQAAIKSLAMGIKSDVIGLRRSCIYLAGYCGIKELVKPLAEQLAIESDNDTKLLIVLAIYKIGDTEAQKAIQELVNNEADPNMRNLVRAVINNFKVHSSFTNN